MAEEAKLTKPPKQPTGKDAGMMAEFEKAMGTAFVESKFLRERSIMLTVKPAALLKAVQWMKQEWGLYHLSTITGMDLQSQIAILYHFEVKETTVTLKVVVPTSDPEVDSITPLIPGATLYEREVFDLLGVKFKGHPKLERIILPEDFPSHVYPLRKDWRSPRQDKPEKPQKPEK
jgi:NADH-quinone oxidoreductase subunit C